MCGRADDIDPQTVAALFSNRAAACMSPERVRRALGMDGRGGPETIWVKGHVRVALGRRALNLPRERSRPTTALSDANRATRTSIWGYATPFKKLVLNKSVIHVVPQLRVLGPELVVFFSQFIIRRLEHLIGSNQLLVPSPEYPHALSGEWSNNRCRSRASGAEGPVYAAALARISTPSHPNPGS